MIPLSELSIADLKAAFDYMKDVQTERAEELRRQSPSIDLKNDIRMREISTRIFHLSRELDKRVHDVTV